MNRDLPKAPALRDAILELISSKREVSISEVHLKFTRGGHAGPVSDAVYVLLKKNMIKERYLPDGTRLLRIPTVESNILRARCATALRSMSLVLDRAAARLDGRSPKERNDA